MIMERSSRSDTHYDVVVVGAGPYGLSTAAHLLGRGLKVGVFGKTLELWRERMPKGMMLRSHWWATNLSDPQGRFTFERFFQESPYDKGYPVPLRAFVEYGLWFRRRVVPNVDEAYVSSIARRNGGFVLGLEDGRAVTSTRVVMAIGPGHYGYRPPEFGNLPTRCVSHSSDHSDFEEFRGKDVVVIGGGQSAIESAALLHEAGARTSVVARRPITWLARDTMDERTLLERIRAPRASVAAGWQFWVLDHLPYAFYRLSQLDKDRYNSNYSSGAAHWLRHRVIGLVTLHEGRTIAAIEMCDGRVRARLSDGSEVGADHVLLGTGYRVDLGRLRMLDPTLSGEIRADGTVPELNAWFESSVPGLYFVGLTALRAFGPLYRFVAGCGATARRVARHVTARGMRR